MCDILPAKVFIRPDPAKNIRGDRKSAENSPRLSNIKNHRPTASASHHLNPNQEQ
jgi:hypothetical protein